MFSVFLIFYKDYKGEKMSIYARFGTRNQLKIRKNRPNRGFSLNFQKESVNFAPSNPKVAD